MALPAAAQRNRAYRCPVDKRHHVRSVSMGMDVFGALKKDLSQDGTLQSRYPLAAGAHYWLRFAQPGAITPGFVLRMGILSDPVRYSLAGAQGEHAWFMLSRVQLRFEAQAEIPLKMSSWSLLTGFGAEYSLVPGISAGGGGISSGTTHTYQIDLDSNFNDLGDKIRRITPFASIGVRYRLRDGNSKWTVYGLLTQNLLPMFKTPYPVNYSIDGQARMATINYVPLSLSIGVTYKF